MRKTHARNSETSTSDGGAAAPARRRMPAAERREQLLAAALGCFARRGFVGAGTRDLARAAGITEPILYRHFDGKAGLFLAVVERAGEDVAAALDETVRDVRGAPERLRALAQGLRHILQEHRDALRVLNAAALAHEEPSILAAASASARRIGLALAAAFRGAGLRRGVRAETAGFLLLEVGLGAAMLRPLAVPEMEAPDYVERVISALLGGIVDRG